MANQFTPISFLIRWIFALVLVIGTYNPTQYCYAQWAMAQGGDITPIVALVGLLLLIAWIIFLRATFFSLGVVGIIMGGALFACVMWLLVDMEVLSLESTGAVTWISLVVLSLLLATGMSWSHIKRRLTGQIDIDDVED